MTHVSGTFNTKTSLPALEVHRDTLNHFPGQINRPLVFSPSITRITAQLTITVRKQNEVSRELFLSETFGVVDKLNHGFERTLHKYAILKDTTAKFYSDFSTTI